MFAKTIFADLADLAIAILFTRCWGWGFTEATCAFFAWITLAILGACAQGQPTMPLDADFSVLALAILGAIRAGVHAEILEAFASA